MSLPSRSAVVTLAMGQATEKLDHTFLSFARHNPSLALHAFILGDALPRQQLPEITYHLLRPVADFSVPLREVYYRRMEVLDALEVDYALTVDCFDVLCFQPLPPFEKLLGGADVAACVEHRGSQYILGQGYTSNYLNGGVFLWDVPHSRDIRADIVGRGRAHFRTVADDQLCINEVIQTKYFDRLRILPSQYNYRPNLNKKQRGWPTVNHLDGVVIYHNAFCMDEAKRMVFKSRASLPPIAKDNRPLSPREQFWRKVKNRLRPHLAE